MTVNRTQVMGTSSFLKPLSLDNISFILSIVSYSGAFLLYIRFFPTVQGEAKVGLQLRVYETSLLSYYYLLMIVFFYTNNCKPTFGPFCI